jgi:hypothetical protein
VEGLAALLHASDLVFMHLLSQVCDVHPRPSIALFDDNQQKAVKGASLLHKQRR